MKKSIFTVIFLLVGLPFVALAGVNPTATYTASDGSEMTAKRYEEVKGEAPLLVRFTANPEDMEAGYTLEWHFDHSGTDGQSKLTRYEENPEFTFTQSGKTIVSLIARMNNEVLDSAAITVNIEESHLEMPNAFSPNGDTHNDFYGAKGACHPESAGRYKSIVEFHGYIFNRWGQKLFEWTDISKGWDGTYNGSPCKDGVYYVLVKARGADGKVYNIRRDVNLIRDFNIVSSSSTGQQ